MPSEEPNSAQEPESNVAAESSSSSDTNLYDDNFQYKVQAEQPEQPAAEDLVSGAN